MQRMWSTYLDSSQLAAHGPLGMMGGGGSMGDVGAQTIDEEEDYDDNGKRDSIHSNFSQANSTAHILPPSSGSLEPPSRPFAPTSPSQSMSSRTGSPLLRSGSPVSLTVNYLPSKFSDALVYNGLRRREKAGSARLPKRGGGVAAFRAGEARVATEGDDDYDGVQSSWFGGNNGSVKKRLRWNRFKWMLFIANTLFTAYSVSGLVFLLCTWFNVFRHADIIVIANTSELILSTVAASLGLITSLVGWAGILLNNRAFLAVYTFLLWICFALLVTPGYMTYKNRNFNISGKVNQQWSQELGVSGWLRIQNQLQCCGFFSPFVEAAVSQTCFARSTLPGCKGPYMEFERKILARWYAIVFGLVPFQIFCIVVGLLCSNHVTYRFGKGMTPKAYRLDMSSMAAIMDQYANQLAEQYGADVASEAVAKSRSNLNLDTLPTVGYSSSSPAGSLGQK